MTLAMMARGSNTINSAVGTMLKGTLKKSVDVAANLNRSATE